LTEPQITRPRILVVDDDPMMGTTLRLALEDDYDVSVSGSAENAMSVLTSEAFDLVLCDLMMPRTSGIDLHRWLRDRDPAAADRMLFMTGGAYTDQAARFLREDAREHVEKPFRVEQLLRKIQSMLDRVSAN
jgi:DNA-binding response OmpR family regulator